MRAPGRQGTPPALTSDAAADRRPERCRCERRPPLQLTVDGAADVERGAAEMSCCWHEPAVPSVRCLSSAQVAVGAGERERGAAGLGQSAGAAHGAGDRERRPGRGHVDRAAAGQQVDRVRGGIGGGDPQRAAVEVDAARRVAAVERARDDQPARVDVERAGARRIPRLAILEFVQVDGARAAADRRRAVAACEDANDARRIRDAAAAGDVERAGSEHDPH